MADTLTFDQLKTIAQRSLPNGSKAWLYGSRARGDEHSDSDWDVLILLDKPSISHADFDKIGYPIIEEGWHFGANISPQLYTIQEWQDMRITPYHQNVERDKKVIYESN